MDKQDRIRIYGARGSRFLKRVGSHFGMMVLFLPFFGLGSGAGMLLVGGGGDPGRGSPRAHP